MKMNFVLEIQFPNPPSAGAQSLEGILEDELPPIGYEYFLTIPQVPVEATGSPFQASLRVKVTRVVSIVNLDRQVTERRVFAEAQMGYPQYRQLSNRLQPDKGWKLGSWR